MGQTLRVDSVIQATRLLTSSSQVIFFTMEQTLRVNSAIQATRLLTSSSQGACSCPKSDTIVLDTEKSVTTMILKDLTNGMSMKHYLLWIPLK